MNHNPYELKVGDAVILDKQFTNKSAITITDFTPNKMYSSIRSEDSDNEWMVMTHRLQPVLEPLILVSNEYPAW
jgi:hypothetical protein